MTIFSLDWSTFTSKNLVISCSASWNQSNLLKETFISKVIKLKMYIKAMRKRNNPLPNSISKRVFASKV